MEMRRMGEEMLALDSSDSDGDSDRESTDDSEQGADTESPKEGKVVVMNVMKEKSGESYNGRSDVSMDIDASWHNPVAAGQSERRQSGTSVKSREVRKWKGWSVAPGFVPPPDSEGRWPEPVTVGQSARRKSGTSEVFKSSKRQHEEVEGTPVSSVMPVNSPLCSPKRR